MENECQQVLILETSDNHKAQEVLRANEYHVNDEITHLILIEEKQEMPIIAKKLFDQRIYSTNFYCKEQNLEDYYLGLLGE